MEGVGEDVYIFGVFVVVASYLLYKTTVYFLCELATDATGQKDETDISRRGRTRSSPHQCSICLEDAQLAVETNCGHVFCTNCLLEVWRRSSQLSAISCPYCRQRITLMLPYFTNEENNTADTALKDDRIRLVAEMTSYNGRNSGEPRSVIEQLRDLPMLLWRPEGFLLAFRVGIVVLVEVWVLYRLFPLDLITKAMVWGTLITLLIFMVPVWVLLFRFPLDNIREAMVQGLLVGLFMGHFMNIFILLGSKLLSYLELEPFRTMYNINRT